MCSKGDSRQIKGLSLVVKTAQWGVSMDDCDVSSILIETWIWLDTSMPPFQRKDVQPGTRCRPCSQGWVNCCRAAV